MTNIDELQKILDAEVAKRKRQHQEGARQQNRSEEGRPGAEKEARAAPSTFDAAPYAFPDPATIPKREWLLGRHYLRGAVGGTVGGPGRLKSTGVLTECVGMAAGLDLLGGGTELPAGPLRVCYLNGEENQTELDRWVAALCQHYGLERQRFAGRLWVTSTRDKPIRVGKFDPSKGVVLARDVIADMQAWCDQNGIDVLVFDPFVSFHAVRENDNGDMDVICKEAFGAIAGTKRSVELVIHPRKLAPGEANTTVDDARGASAQHGALRLMRTFNFMTTKEAGSLGISEDDRRRHVRIDSGKANPAPLGKAKWLRIEVEDLPNGDHVAVASSWSPPNAFHEVSVADIHWIRALVQKKAYRADSQAKEWIGKPLAERLNLDLTNKQSKAKVKHILQTWMKNGVLDTEERPDKKSALRDFVIIGDDWREAEVAPEDGDLPEDALPT
jgi:hypothetical protein